MNLAGVTSDDDATDDATAAPTIEARTARLLAAGEEILRDARALLDELDGATASADERSAP